MIDGVEVVSLRKFTDSRGWLAETWREDEMPPGVAPKMSYISETLPGVTRGPHEHREQTDVFIFLGPGTFRVFLWDARTDSETFGEKLVLEAGEKAPTRIVIPPGVVHAYRCVSGVPGWCINLPDRLYAGRGKREPVDEIRHEEEADSPYRMD